MTLGQRIGQYRKNLGISQEELGGRLGVSRQAVSKWETDASAPDTENLLALSREFGVSLAELTATPAENAPAGKKHPWRLPALCGVLALAVAAGALVWAYHGGETNNPKPSPPAEIPDTDFLLLWDGPDRQDWLTLGTQESLFPFGRTLIPTGPETITDSGFPNDVYHDITCGDLTLRYSHMTETTEYDVLRMLETGSRKYQTPRGIGVGSSEADVLAAYGDELIYCLPTHGPETTISYDEYFVYTPEGFDSLLFLMAGDHVVGIRMEDASYPYYHVNHRDSFPVVDGEADFSHRQEVPQTTEQAVYGALNALVTRSDLTAEELYTNRNTIFCGLSDLDWWKFGSLGTTEHPEDTIGTLLSWLREQAPYTEAEIFRLQMGCLSNLDGWLADSYAHVLSGALFSDPAAFVKGLAYEGLEDCMSNAVRLTAYDAIWYTQETDAAVETLASALTGGKFTEMESGWCRLLLLYLTAETEDGSFADLPKTPAELP